MSPIFTMWLTLLLMYAANCLADYSAAATLNAAYTADLRKGGCDFFFFLGGGRQLAGMCVCPGAGIGKGRVDRGGAAGAASQLPACPGSACLSAGSYLRFAPAELASRARRLRRHQRRRSADYAHDVRSAASWATASDAGSEGGASSALSLRDAWASLAGAASRSSFDLLLHRTMSSVGQMLHSPTSTMRRAGSMLFRDDFGIGLATSWLQQAGRWERRLGAAGGGRRPEGVTAGCRIACPHRLLHMGGMLWGGAQPSALSPSPTCPEPCCSCAPSCSLPDERLLEPGKVPIPPDAPSPSFLPMFPW